MHYFLLFNIILDFDKNFATIRPRRVYQPFSFELSAGKCNFINIVRQILGQKRICIPVEPNTGKIDRHKHFFIFQCFKRMFSIDEPHYCCSANIQPMAHFHVIFSHFNIHFIEDINNILSSKYLLLMGWWIPCIFCLL